MISDNPHSEFSPRARPSNSGFTLIELLMVIAVIGILSGITFGISQGVQNARSRTQAKAEIAVLSQALELFKTRSGDYPWVSGDPAQAEENGKLLFQALVGWMEFTRSGVVTNFDVKTVAPLTGAAYVDISKLTYVNLSQTDDYNPEIDLSASPTNYAFLDPWGKPYVYAYGRTGAGNTWEVFGYHLYSTGADGSQLSSVVDASTGVMDSDFRESGSGENADNIYAGE
jgi:general secretion pathway protein G